MGNLLDSFMEFKSSKPKNLRTLRTTDEFTITFDAVCLRNNVSHHSTRSRESHNVTNPCSPYNGGINTANH